MIEGFPDYFNALAAKGWTCTVSPSAVSLPLIRARGTTFTATVAGGIPSAIAWYGLYIGPGGISERVDNGTPRALNTRTSPTTATFYFNEYLTPQTLQLVAVALVIPPPSSQYPLIPVGPGPEQGVISNIATITILPNPEYGLGAPIAIPILAASLMTPSAFGTLAVSQCQQTYGDWGPLNTVRDYICKLQGIPTS